MEARGFLALLMSYSDNWEFRKAHLIGVSGLGETRWRRVLRELQVAGYLRLEHLRSEGGRMDGTNWVIVDEPRDRTFETNVSVEATEALVSRLAVEPEAGETNAHKKTNFSKKNKKQEERESARSSSSSSRGTEIPEDWKPCPAEIELARHHGLTDRDIKSEAAVFVSWHRAKGTKTKDVTATWTMWLQRYKDFKKKENKRDDSLDAFRARIFGSDNGANAGRSGEAHHVERGSPSSLPGSAGGENAR